jgi:hypothetical protein
MFTPAAEVELTWDEAQERAIDLVNAQVADPHPEREVHDRRYEGNDELGNDRQRRMANVVDDKPSIASVLPQHWGHVAGLTRGEL